MDPVHLLNPLADPAGGSEWRSVSLFGVLADHGPVNLWALAPHRDFMGVAPMRTPDPARGILPQGGTLVIVGAYFQIPPWVRAGRFRRVILIYNVPEPHHIRHAASTLSAQGIDDVEYVVSSPALRDELRRLGLPCSRIEASWVDLDAFRPKPNLSSRANIVGRLSRDVPEKFHETDPELFLQLAKSGFRVRLMGATCIAGQLGDHPHIEVLPAGAEPASDFLQTVDVLLHRTSVTWYESFGRVVFEAMASGVVPVVGARGGYADFLVDGEGVFLFRDNQEALARIQRLRDEPGLLSSTAGRARAFVEDLYGAGARRSIQNFYFGR